jgi:hypothetical protein
MISWTDGIIALQIGTAMMLMSAVMGLNEGHRDNCQ